MKKSVKILLIVLGSLILLYFLGMLFDVASGNLGPHEESDEIEEDQ